MKPLMHVLFAVFIYIIWFCLQCQFRINLGRATEFYFCIGPRHDLDRP